MEKTKKEKQAKLKTNKDKFTVTEEEQVIKYLKVEFKYATDKKQYSSFSKSDRRTFQRFISRNLMDDGNGSLFRLTMGQKAIMEEVLKELYINGQDTAAKISKLTRDNLLKRSRDIGKKYNNDIGKILKSEDKWILTSKKFGGKKNTFFKGNEKSISESIAKMRPHFLHLRHIRKTKTQYIVVWPTPLAKFIGRLLSKDEIIIEVKERKIKEDEKNDTSDNSNPKRDR